MKLLKSIWKLLFEVPEHVRISPIGWKIINSPSLSKKVVDAIINNHSKLADGEEIKIEGTDYSIQFTTRA